jgi:hypothetical protein
MMDKEEMIKKVVYSIRLFANRVESGQIEIDNYSMSGADCSTGLSTITFNYKEVHCDNSSV